MLAWLDNSEARARLMDMFTGSARRRVWAQVRGRLTLLWRCCRRVRKRVRREVCLHMTMPLLTAGADEAGRGPLAGPVVAGAVILAPTKPIPGLADSKTLSPDEREELAIQIRTDALAWAVACADVGEIDGINILREHARHAARVIGAATSARTGAGRWQSLTRSYTPPAR